jgi:arylsulfatase A-like enzyme
MIRINRRDFLKLSSVFLGASVFSRLGYFPHNQSEKKPNIIVLVFDSMSARHLSIYGYPRSTTPNFERFAKRATVFHANYAAANFTTSGTATILTGMYPWKHRALNAISMVARELAENNLFNLLGSDYYTVGFSQNYLANILLSQFKPYLNWQLPPSSFYSTNKRPDFLFHIPKDDILAYYALDDYLSLVHQEVNPIPGSLSLGFLDTLITRMQVEKEKPTEIFPYGKPSNPHFYFDNETVFREIAKTIEKLNHRSPFVGYFHFFAPHSPYAPQKDFVGLFNDMPLAKKQHHPLSIMKYPQRVLKANRDRYDEYIANVDAEFGNLLDFLESRGILDNSFLVIAADHGELFERGEVGHGTKLLYESVIRTPLIISSPKQEQRVDIHSNTCNTDIIPTLLHNTGSEIPAKLDGNVLPGFGGTNNTERSIFSMVAKESSSFQPLTEATIALNKNTYKLIYYFGNEKFDGKFELFNLAEDLHELTDIVDTDIVTASRMKEELLTALNEANRTFYKN